MATVWYDRIAAPRKRSDCAENISDLLMDSSKINMMCLLGCDEKYKKAFASDCELLMEWERILPLCGGSGAAALYEAEKKWLGVDGMSFEARWQKGCSRLWEVDLSAYTLPVDRILLSDFVMEFIKKKGDGEISVSALARAALESVKLNDFKEIHLVCSLPDAPFVRPNVYAAEQVLSRIIRGEKYKSEEWGMLLCQVAISLAKVLTRDKECVLHLYCRMGYTPVFDALSYLLDHRLFKGRVAVGLFLDHADRAFEPLCRAQERLKVEDGVALGAELILTVPDFAEGFEERLARLFRLYPRGGVSLGGVLTDSPAYFIADRWALDVWKKIVKE